MKPGTASIGNWVSSLNHRQYFYFVIISKEGILKFINAFFYKNFHQPDHPFKENNFFNLIHQNDRELFKRAVTGCSEGSRPLPVEIRIKNGHYHWIKWEVNYVKNPRSEAENYFCLGYEIPKEKKPEDYEPCEESSPEMINGPHPGVLLSKEKKLELELIENLGNQLVQQKLNQQKSTAEAIIQAQEEERSRIGCELHDNVNQMLSTAQLYLNLLNPGNENFDEIRKKSRETVMLAIEEIRKLSKTLVMPNLKSEGLVSSINELIADLRIANPFVITFTHCGCHEIELIGQNRKINLFRIIQEQIKNIIKYSKAKNVNIDLKCNEDPGSWGNPSQVRMQIQDDGIGFDPNVTRKGLGLTNIYERTQLLNGKVILRTSPGKGCSLIVNIPIGSKKWY